ncbi:MAG: hypothetical protein GX802_00695 [Clostridiales bacterium]|jgi:hypothetical protein|nr:hypothetical protein [Clostridiales bacterium]
MSLGYIGYCKLINEDEKHVYYAYSGANWNDANRDREAERAYDGLFSIDKSVMQRWSEVKQLDNSIYLTAFAIENNYVNIIRLCKNAFNRYSVKIDYIVFMLLNHVFNHLISEGVFPNNEAFIQ